ncbi:TetR/AcrR family transcriptional regulator [Rhodopseudomonas sp. RCAM05734]|uniref:TetR/AcrR family transcriptional regulator n=1 Tax=Rhodopseudomonas sp. RCAM05734 TaxID=3457549 RepID=UPI004044EB2B
MTLKTKVRQRGRPRSEAGRQAILSTAGKLLYEVGLQQMSMEEIAKQSGVGKATLYRWWPSKTMIALDAYLEEMRGKVIVPDTGSAKEDFRQQIRSVIKFYAGKEGEIFSSFIAAAQGDLDFAVSFRDKFLNQRREGVRMIWDRGVKTGEFRDDVTPEVALDMMYALIVYRLLTGRAQLSLSLADEIVDVAMKGLIRRA